MAPFDIYENNKPESKDNPHGVPPLNLSDSTAIVLRPAKHIYPLDTLLDGITQENLHGEQDFGKCIGREE